MPVWKSTVVGDLLAFLFVDVLPNHLISNRAGSDCQVASCLQVPPPELIPQIRKLLQ